MGGAQEEWDVDLQREKGGETKRYTIPNVSKQGSGQRKGRRRGTKGAIKHYKAHLRAKFFTDE